MMTVSGTILLTYFATEIAEMSKEGEDYTVSLHFLHKCMVALIQVTKTTRDTILTRRHRCKLHSHRIFIIVILKVNQCLVCLYILLLRKVSLLSKIMSNQV
jgi:hypothetical protein